MFSTVFNSNYDQHCLRFGLPVRCVSVENNVSKLPSSFPPHPHARLLTSLPLSYNQLRSLGNGKSWDHIINHSFVQDRDESKGAGMAIMDECFVPLLKGQWWGGDFLKVVKWLTFSKDRVEGWSEFSLLCTEGRPVIWNIYKETTLPLHSSENVVKV